jgi:hypothetical protein
MKYSLYLQDRKEPIEMDDKDILCNDVTLPWEYDPRKVRLWVIGNEYGPLVALWADGASDAMDELIDSGKGDSFLIEPKDLEDYRTGEDSEGNPGYDVCFLGNAGEPCDTEYLWLSEVVLKPERDYKLLCALAYAQGAGQDTLFA